MVSHFQDGVAGTDIVCWPYGGSVFAKRLSELDQETVEVAQACPLYHTVLTVRELVCPKASRRFLRSILEWLWDTTNTFHLP